MAEIKVNNSSSKKIIKKYYLPLGLYALFIFILSSIPSDEFPEIDVPFIDKYTHFIEYAIFSFLTIRALIKEDTIKNYISKSLSAIVITALYGATDELHQLFVPGRNCEIMDLLADLLGAFIGVVIWRITRFIWKKN